MNLIVIIVKVCLIWAISHSIVLLGLFVIDLLQLFDQLFLALILASYNLQFFLGIFVIFLQLFHLVQ